MTDDELEDLRRENRALKARVDALSKQLDELKDLVIGQDREMSESEVEEARNFFDRVGDVENEMGEVSKTARAAVAASDARADGGSPSKKELTMNKARNRLVTNAAAKSGTKHKIKFATIQDAVERADIKYQTVKDATAELSAKWDAFETGKDENGDWVLKLFESELSNELVYTVEADLERDDLTKRLISDNTRVGVK